ncbi:MAG: Maf family nucleotide pyrophosphatase [Phycisphaerales bacterium]|nr:Maf family nucleotide pyrophosphatase [Phycisphaerales bacterium]
MRWPTPLILASTSPRRRELLQKAGIEAIVVSPAIDDSHLTCGDLSPEVWVRVLAILKARSTSTLRDTGTGTILAADTVCVVDDTILGQPQSEQEALQMLVSMVQRDHEVYTGWCLKTLDGKESLHGCETTIVSIGAIDLSDLEAYVASGLWQGKAGGYNLGERCAAGWPLSWQGDPTNVMGLPMKRLIKELSRK